MRYRVVHETRYSCSELVSVGHNEARLKLRSTPRQFLIGHTLDINPLPSVRTDSVDYFGNCVTRFSFNHGYQQLVVNSTNEVEIVDAIPLTDIGPAWEELTPANAEGHGHNDLGVIEFRFESPRCRVVNDLAYYARATFTPGKPVAQAAIELMERIHRGPHPLNKFSGFAAASAKISPTCSFQCSVPWDFARDMSAVTCARFPRPGRPN